MRALSLAINGRNVRAEVEPRLSLVDFLRAVIPRFPEHQADRAAARMQLAPVLAAAMARFMAAHPAPPQRRGQLDASMKALET